VKEIGRRTWAIAGGHIPLDSTGHEPEFTSHDRLCILNTTDHVARVELTILYADREPVGPYRLEVPARRVCQYRFNDLIDPQAMPLDADYGCVVECNVPIVVQFSRLDSRQAENAIFSTMAYAAD
jgi:hypothetical protein